MAKKKSKQKGVKAAVPKDAKAKVKASAKKAVDKAQQVTKSDALIAKLTARLAKAEARAEKWKAEAKRLRTEAKASDAMIAEAPKPAEESAPEPVTAPEPVKQRATKPAPTVTSGKSTPDTSWTVAALKQEARRRGLAGYSRMSKAELLDLLEG